MQSRRVAAAGLSLCVVLCTMVLPTGAFVPSALPTQCRGLPSLCRTHAVSRTGVTSLRSQAREDGSTEEQVAEAYKVYENLMRTSNDGQGYWMDSPFQFFDNIKQAVERNFGGSKGLSLLDDKPSNAVDLGSSPFSPLVSAGDVDTSEEETTEDEEETAFPVAGELEVSSAGKKKKAGKKKGKKGKAKASDGSLDDAKAKAAALKAKLESDD